MVLASQLRSGTFLKIGGDLFKVIESSFHVGQGKMPGSVHAKLQDVRRATFRELRWRPEERLDDVQLQRHDMEFLYSDDDSATFMNPVNFEQTSISLEAIGPAAEFLKAEMTVPVEFYEGQPVSIAFPEFVELKVGTTAAPVHAGQDDTFKYATLENGLEVMVPQFIKPGEVVRIEVRTKKYADRVRTGARRV